MCRMSVIAATALILAAGATPAAAGAKAKAAPNAGRSSSTSATATPPATAQAERPLPASAEQREVARRLDPLARAAFWARETSLDASDPEAAIGLSQALRELGRAQEAAEPVRALLAARPDNLEGLLELARVYLTLSQGFYAIEPAQKARSLAPRDWRAPGLLAIAFEQAQRDDEALRAHREAIAIAPDNPAPLTNLGMFLAGRGQIEEAERILQQASALPGADARTRQNLALVLGLQGRLGEAEALARRDLPPDVVANNLAWLRAASSTQAPRSWSTVRDASPAP